MPIGAGQAQAYCRSEFPNAKENYYAESERALGEWQRELAERHELCGQVNEKRLAWLS